MNFPSDFPPPPVFFPLFFPIHPRFSLVSFTNLREFEFFKIKPLVYSFPHPFLFTDYGPISRLEAIRRPGEAYRESSGVETAEEKMKVKVEVEVESWENIIRDNLTTPELNK